MVEDKSVVEKLISPFIYFFLGCYYTLYGLLYPIYYISKSLGDLIYNLYAKKQAPETVVTSEVKVSNKTLSERVKEIDVNEELRKQEEKVAEPVKLTKRQIRDENTRRQLYESLQHDTFRSDVPLTFRYTAIDSDGKKETNTFIAYSKMEVYTYLENEKYKVLKINTSKLIEFLYGPSSLNTPKFKNRDLIFWLTQLSTYIKSGIPLTDSMRILSKQMSKDKNKKRVFDSIIYNLTLGESFSSALEKQNKVFPQLLINMIKAAEVTGELEETLDDMADYYNDMETTRKQMISAMSYPAIIMVFSFAVIIFILIYVIPEFEMVYHQAGAELNPLTSAVIVASKFLQENIMFILLIFASLVLLISLLYRRIKAFRAFMQKIGMKIPLLGKIIIYKEMNIFAKTFSSLLKNNVFITESIDILTSITKNEIYRSIMIQTIDNIAKGEKISTSFQDHWAVPDVAYYMIVTGESTGELAEMMSKVADYYQTSHKSIINSMKSFIEPAMIITLALVVGGIVLSVILPMFGLYSEIQ